MTTPSITIGVLALQGAFEEHQRCIESISPSITTLQIRTPSQLSQIDGIIFPGGESTAMGLIGDATTGLWGALRTFVRESGKPTWGTCAGMILLAERCVGTSAVITKGQSLIGGVDILVCRNYFGSQISSFEMDTPAPPRPEVCVDGMTSCSSAEEGENASFPGVFIRAPAILTAGAGVEVLGKVVAAPWASDETNAREVICAVKKGNILCTAFHPEIADDLRWHEYFVGMVLASKQSA
ncbi:predicted protein [Thalassiosira pseudonana CCMP1335]|uniref:glutaminase n=1 Tax=Thalassiosira pseudonana TaxID=35128 RepID=B8BUV0_THAPS|nr:predicted protein [Thalassiosira pseudonana CCMP1335]EED94823.1 predicted protein [Thalassiosira pseudonana CCMP1335]